MVHRREIDGQEIVFGNQGDLLGNAMTWWDHDTGSIWSQPLGEAIAGPRKGQTIELLPSTLTQWSSWRELHPDTLGLDAENGRSGFDLERMAIVVEFGPEAVAYPVVELREAGAVNDVINGVPVVITVDPGDEQRWAVFSRRLDNDVLELEVADGSLIDTETSTVWDSVRGRAIEGPLLGEIMDPLPAITAFPEDFSTFWPQGRIWRLGDPAAPLPDSDGVSDGLERKLNPASD